jgi:hypothetical protein
MRRCARQRDTSSRRPRSRHFLMIAVELTAALARGRVIEPLLRLLVAPAGNGEARSRRRPLIRTRRHMRARARMGHQSFVARGRLRIGRCATCDQQTHQQKRAHWLLLPSGLTEHVRHERRRNVRRHHDRSNQRHHRLCGYANWKLSNAEPQSHTGQKGSVAPPRPALTWPLVHRPIEERRRPRGK